VQTPRAGPIESVGGNWLLATPRTITSVISPLNCGRWWASVPLVTGRVVLLSGRASLAELET